MRMRDVNFDEASVEAFDARVSVFIGLHRSDELVVALVQHADLRPGCRAAVAEGGVYLDGASRAEDGLATFRPVGAHGDVRERVVRCDRERPEVARENAVDDDPTSLDPALGRAGVPERWRQPGALVDDQRRAVRRNRYEVRDEWNVDRLFA